MTPEAAVAPPAAVLFDLDGTLLDTAPDMGAALNRLLVRHGRPTLPAGRIRPHVSSGTRGMLHVGFGIGPEAPAWPALKEEYLALYAADLCRGTDWFPGVRELLAVLANQGIAWGIVTNKPAWLTDPLLVALDCPLVPACVVSGDTAPRPKPHPDPLLYGARLLGEAPWACWYVGDHQRDILAGRAAGMVTIAAGYGYLGPDSPPAAWGADALIDHPLELLALLRERSRGAR